MRTSPAWFSTKPDRPRRVASAKTKGRNPTPWTTPQTRTRRRCTTILRPRELDSPPCDRPVRAQAVRRCVESLLRCDHLAVVLDPAPRDGLAEHRQPLRRHLRLTHVEASKRFDSL